MAESYFPYRAVGQINCGHVLNASGALVGSYSSRKIPVRDVQMKTTMVNQLTPLKTGKMKKPDNITYRNRSHSSVANGSINGTSILRRIWLALMQFKIYTLHDLEILFCMFIREILKNVPKETSAKMNMLCL